MLQDLDIHLHNAVQSVFRTMLNYQLEAVAGATWRVEGEPHMAACVAFTGAMDGVVYVYASERFARQMATRLLGSDETTSSGDEIVCDAMGEIANMIAGPIKSRLSDRGIACVLSIPAIVRGTNFSIESVSSSERRLFVYRCRDGDIAAEVLIRSRS